MKTIAIASPNGGVGKTTTAWTLAHSLAQKDFKVLCLDLDDQIDLSTLNLKNSNFEVVIDDLISGNLTLSKNVEDTDKELDITTAFLSPEDTYKCIKHLETFDLIPGSEELNVILERDIGSTLEMEDMRTFLRSEEGETKIQSNYFDNILKYADRLRDILSAVKDDYDFCIIDTSPVLSAITFSSLIAADYLIIPAQLDYRGLHSLNNIDESLQKLILDNNPNLKVLGMLFRIYKTTSEVSQKMWEDYHNLAEDINIHIFDQTIQEDEIVKEAQAMLQTPFTFAPEAPVTDDYRKFTDEVLQRI